MAPLRARRGGVGARRRRARPGGAAPREEESGRSGQRSAAGQPSRCGPRGHLLSLRTCSRWGLGSRCLPVGPRRGLQAVGAGSSALMRAPPPELGSRAGARGTSGSPCGSRDLGTGETGVLGPSSARRRGVRKGAEIPPEMLASPRAAEGGARVSVPPQPRGPGARIREEASGAGPRKHQLVATTLPPVPQPPTR